MTTKRYQAKRPISLLVPSGVANRAVATLDGTTMTMPSMTTGMVDPAAMLGRATTRVVAASNASAQMRAMADYVCDGVADEVEINAALAALGSVGGTVLLSEGTFTLAAPVVVGSGSVDRQSLRGMGREATTLVVVNSGGAPINTYIVSLNGYYSTLSDLTIDGNKANNATATNMMGVALRSSNMLGGLVERVRVVNSAQRGLVFDMLASNAIIRDCLIENSAATGIQVDASANQPCLISGCTVKSSGTHGFVLASGPVVLSDCQSLGNTYAGFWVDTNALASLTNCTAQNNGAHGFSITATRTMLAGCRAISNVDTGFWTTGTQTQFTGCVATETSGEGNGFRVSVGAVDPLFDGCTAIANSNAGFRHLSAGKATYVGCSVIGGGSYGFQVTDGTASIFDCSVTSVSYGAMISGGSRHVVDGSRFDTIQGHGIYIADTAPHAQVTNNSVVQAGLGANNTYWGIAVEGDTGFIAGNTVRDGAGNRPYGAIAAGGSTTNTFIGHNDMHGAGYSVEIGDFVADTRCARKLLLDYVASTDISPGSVPAGTWTNVGAAQSFTVGSSRSTIEIACMGNPILGSVPSIASYESRLLIDGSVPKVIGAEHGESTGGYQNPLAGNVSIKLGLTAGAHTVRLQVYSSQNATCLLRANTINEALIIQVTEHAR